MLTNLLSNPLLPVILGLIGLFAALIVYWTVKASPAGEGRVKEIGDEIHLGAMVFMSTEYSRLAIFCVICILALWRHWAGFQEQGRWLNKVQPSFGIFRTRGWILIVTSLSTAEFIWLRELNGPTFTRYQTLPLSRSIRCT